jgi:hypothetical protein
LECGEFSPLLPQADWSACQGSSSAGSTSGSDARFVTFAYFRENDMKTA